MSTYQTPAIVIGRHNFGEADRIMVILTPERGVIRAVAKGVRRIKSKLAGHLELFCQSDLMLVEGRNLDILTSARLQHHVSVTNDYDCMKLAYLVAEMVNKLGSEGEHPGLYELVQQTLRALEEGTASDTLELWFKIRLLDTLGYRPELGACIVCGTADPHKSYRFNQEQGGIVDQGCAQAGNMPMSHDHIKFWRVLLDYPLEVAQRVPSATQLAAETMPICSQFYAFTFGKTFKSAEALG